MKIEQLKLENFKCFKTEKTFDFGRLTLLTGANSSGKSTVMQAILSAVQSDGFPSLLSPNGKYVDLGDFEEITYNGNNNIVKLGFKFDDRILDTTWTKDTVNFLPMLNTMTHILNDIRNIKIAKRDNGLYEFIFTYTELGQAAKIHEFLKLEHYLQKYHIQSIFNEYDLELISTFDNFYKFCSKISIDAESLDNQDVTFSFIDILPYFDGSFCKSFDETMNYIGPFRQPPFRTYIERNKRNLRIGIEGEGFTYQILKWEQQNDPKIQILANIMRKMDLIEALKIKRLSGGRFELLVKPTNSAILTSLSNVGFGVSQFLPILVADLQLPNDSTLFLAEPEIHLHPSVQSKFGEYIVNQINTSDKNYVIETHSEYLLNRIRLAIVKGELKPSDLKVYFLENTKKDTDVYDIEFTKTGAIQNAPPTFFETYSVDSMAIALNAFSA